MKLSGRVNRNLFSLADTGDCFRVVFGKRASMQNDDVYFQNAALTASHNLLRDFLKVYFSIIY
jgi:hypothetical protein